MSCKVERLPPIALLGEGPHWDEETSSLYFVDVFGKAIHKYTPSTNFHAKASGEKGISFIIPVDGQPGKFAIGYSDEIRLIEWDGKSERFTVVKPLAVLPSTGEEGKGADVKAEHLEAFESLSKLTIDEATYIWNDAKVDSAGRLWAGSISLKSGNRKGNLYALISEGKSLKTQAENISLSNGLAWDDNLGKLYYVDSFQDVIYQFDYNAEDCSTSKQEVIFSSKKNGVTGLLDGMAIDDEGNLWVACFGTSSVIKIDPRRPDTLLQTVEIPTEQVTSVAFGGENLNELYVTTGNLDMKQTDKPLKDGPEHGALYRITGLGVKGVRANKMKLDVIGN